MDDSEVKLLQEVAIRNAIAMFRKKNAAEGRTASIPMVGIFWMDDTGTIFSDGVSLRDAEDYGEFKTFEGSHYELWDKAVAANPKWKGLEYDEVPRGRVVYRKDAKKPEFIVYMPQRIAKHKNKLYNEFSLPSGFVRFDYSDEHYRM